jgi:hypothetical protein
MISRRSLLAKGLRVGGGGYASIWDVGERSGPAFKKLVGKPEMSSSLLGLRRINNNVDI